MTSTIRTIHYGLGPIGCAIARLVSSKPGFQIAGGVDIAPDKVGKDFGEVLGTERLNITVADELTKALAAGGADIVVHSTSSQLRQNYQQIAAALGAGLSVVSTCEELSYPQAQHADLATELDQLAKEQGVALLGTGINPGFAMDTLILALTAPCQEVKRIQVTRVSDAAQRRLPLQQKIGAGLAPEEFNKLVAEGKVRHVGLLESAMMIAAALGWQLESAREVIEPVIADQEVRSQYLVVKPGEVAGVRQILRGVRDGQEVLTLELQMYLGAREPRDAVLIEGTPSVDMVVRGGFLGDLATAGIVVNAIPRVLAAPPGLWTMKDIPLVHALPA